MAKKTTKAPEATAQLAAPVVAPVTGAAPVMATDNRPAKGSPEAIAKMAALRAARGTGDNENDVFVFIPFTPAPNAVPPVLTDPRKKLAPQAMTVVSGIASQPAGITRKALIAAILPVLVTRQGPARIITYYQKEIVANGYATLTKAPVAAAPVTAPAK